MIVYLENNKQGKYGRHKYSLEEYGFNAESLYEEYKDYMDLYGLHIINTSNAWDITIGSHDVVVAVIDTGVDYNHPDLQDKVIIGRNFTDVGGQCDPMDNDISSHGTRDAGVAAATTNNGIGVAGTAWSPKIVAIKVADQAHGAGGGASALALAEGIQYAVNPYPPPFGCPDVPKADVININFNGPEDNPLIKDAINTALSNNVLVVAGVANNRDAGECFMGYPAAYPDVISVGGTNLHDAFSSGCHQPAPETMDNGYTLVAPEKDIYGPVEGGGYGGDSGTSLAGPFVAGALATLLSINPDPGAAKDALINSVDDLGQPGYDPVYGYGRLNFCKLVGGDCPPSVSLYVSKDPNDPYQHIKNVDVGEMLYITVKAQYAAYGPGLIREIGFYDFSKQKWFMQMCSSTAGVCEYKWNWFFDSSVSGKSVGLIGGALDTFDNQGFSHFSMGYPYRIYVYGGGISIPGGENGNSLPPYLKELTTSPGSVKINLNWTDTTGESGFALQKSIGGDTFFDFKELSADATSYSDTLPSSQEGKNLTYRVRARFSDNSYSLSNEQSVDAPTSYIPPDEWPGTVELTTSCDDNDIQAHLTFAPIQESAWYHIYDSYQGSSEQYVVKLRAQDFPPDENIYYDWKARNKWGGDLEVLNANEYSVRVVAESSSGDISSGLVWAPATDCSPALPIIDPPGTGDLNVTISCDTSSYAWAHADWSRRGGYTGLYLFQYKLSSQSTWTNSATGGKYGTWDDVGLLTFTNGNHNFRVITTHDNQVWASPITVNVYCEPYVPVLEVSYRCSEDGGPVADLSWSIPRDPYHELSYYEIEYQRPGENWRWGLAPGPEDAAGISTEDWWSGEPLVSGEIWGWKVGAHYWGYPTTDWAGPIYTLIPYFPANCSQALAGPQSPSTIVNDTSGPSGASRSWLNPQLAGYSDDSYATAVVNAESGSTTHYLKATGFGLSIPQEAVIDGIRVVVERRRDGETATDASVKLVKGGSVVGQEKGDWYTNWWAFDTNQSYGGSNDLWNTTWTPSDINNPNFGVAFAGNAGLPPEGNESLYVDNIRAMVYYTSLVSVSFPLSCDSFGDVDNDGFVSQSDVDLIAAYIAGGSLSEEQKRRADVNGDGNVSQADLDIVENYIITGISTFPVCEDPDNDGLPNYQDTDDDGDIAPTVSLTVNPATATAGEPFIITVTGTSPVGLAVVWWFGQNTGIMDATVTITYPPEPTSLSKPCADVVNPTKLDRAFCSPLFDAQQTVTSYSFTSSITINQPGTYRIGANARDVLYPIPGEAHQASEGTGIQVVEVQNQPPTLAAIGSQTATEGQLLNVTVSATDPDNDPLTYNAIDLPQGASFSGQTFSWTPSYQQAGIYEATFTVSDGSLIDSKTTAITVLNDEDQDGFADTVELYIGTDPYDACPDRKENYNPAYPGDDAWPPDFNNSGKVTRGDLVPFRQHYEPSGGIYDKRFDLNADGRITTDDLAIFNKYLLKRCSL